MQNTNRVIPEVVSGLRSLIADVMKVKSFTRDPSARTMDFQELSTQLLPGCRGIPLQMSPNLNLTFRKCLIIIRCSKCSLTVHCVTTEDSGGNGTQRYHRGETALSGTIRAKWHSVLSSGRNGNQWHHQGEMALGVIIGAKWHSVLSSGRNYTYRCHQGDMALGVAIGAKWHLVFPSGPNVTQCYHRGEMTLIVAIGAKLHLALPSRRHGTRCCHRDEKVLRFASRAN